MNKQSPGGATFLRRGHSMSLLQGLGSCGKRFRGLKPTATSCRRGAAEDVGKPKDQVALSVSCQRKRLELDGVE